MVFFDKRAMSDSEMGGIIQKNLHFVLNELEGQNKLKESIPKDNLGLNDSIYQYRELIDHEECMIAYECILSLISYYPCNLSGECVSRLIQVAILYGDSPEYKYFLPIY